jgi:hypothetical protein
LTINTKYNIADEVWYFKDSVPTKTEVKTIEVKIERLPRLRILIKYELLRDNNLIYEEKLFSSKIELYGSLEDEKH